MNKNNEIQERVELQITEWQIKLNHLEEIKIQHQEASNQAANLIIETAINTLKSCIKDAHCIIKPKTK